MLLFTCPRCGLQKPMRDERLGTPTRCRGCAEAFTLTLENCKPTGASSNRLGRNKSATPASRAAEESAEPSAAVEGALPGVTAGAVAGLLGGCLSGADVGTAVSWVIVGIVVGIGTGLVLGGLAGMYSQRVRRQKTWQRWPAPILLGATVGLVTVSLLGGLSILPWGGLAGMAAAGIWPLLGQLTQDRQRPSLNPLADGRDERSRAVHDDVRHYIDPNELDDTLDVGKRRDSR